MGTTRPVRWPRWTLKLASIAVVILAALWLLQQQSSQPVAAPQGHFDIVMHALWSQLWKEGRLPEDIDELEKAGYIRLPLIKEDGTEVRFIELGESPRPGDMPYLPARLLYVEHPDLPEYQENRVPYLILYGTQKRADHYAYFDFDRDGEVDPVVDMHGGILSYNLGNMRSARDEPLFDMLLRRGYWTEDDVEAALKFEEKQRALAAAGGE